MDRKALLNGWGFGLLMLAVASFWLLPRAIYAVRTGSGTFAPIVQRTCSVLESHGPCAPRFWIAIAVTGALFLAGGVLLTLAAAGRVEHRSSPNAVVPPPPPMP